MPLYRTHLTMFRREEYRDAKNRPRTRWFHDECPVGHRTFRALEKCVVATEVATARQRARRALDALRRETIEAVTHSATPTLGTVL